MYSRIKYAVRTVWDPGRHAVIVGTRSPIPLDSVAGLNGNRGGRECSPTALPDCHDCRGRTSEMGNHNKHKNQKRIQRPVCKRYFHNRNGQSSCHLGRSTEWCQIVPHTAENGAGSGRGTVLARTQGIALRRIFFRVDPLCQSARACHALCARHQMVRRRRRRHGN